MYIDVKIGEPYSCQISNVLGGQLLRPARAQIPTLQPDTLGGGDVLLPVLVLRVHQTFSCVRPPNIVLVPIVGERLFIEIIYCLLVSGREKSNSHDKCVVKPGKRTMKNINTGFRYFF